MRVGEWINENRIFPRIMAIFLGYMLYTFHMWFTQDGTLLVTELKDWSLMQYAAVLGAYIGFAKFYMETGLPKDRL